MKRAIGGDWKLAVAGIGAGFHKPRLVLAAYVAVALIWLVPDRRIERAVMGK